MVAVLPGSDPTLAGEYVAIGAHNDRIGIRQRGAIDHDSLRAYNQALVALGDLVESVNRDDHHGFTFNYAKDANGHPENIHCRSDHAKPGPNGACRQ